MNNAAARTITNRDGISVPLFASHEVGRYATKVRIREGAFAEKRGVVSRIHHEEAVSVRFDSGLELPFGPSELEAI